MSSEACAVNFSSVIWHAAKPCDQRRTTTGNLRISYSLQQANCPENGPMKQTTGLFFTSIAATQDFGSFFAFTVSVRASAKLIWQAVRKSNPARRID